MAAPQVRRPRGFKLGRRTRLASSAVQNPATSSGSAWLPDPSRGCSDTICVRAEVAEWQTRRSQTPLRATSCGFESHLRYQASYQAPSLEGACRRRESTCSRGDQSSAPTVDRGDLFGTRCPLCRGPSERPHGHGSGDGERRGSRRRYAPVVAHSDWPQLYRVTLTGMQPAERDVRTVMSYFSASKAVVIAVEAHYQGKIGNLW